MGGLSLLLQTHIAPKRKFAIIRSDCWILFFLKNNYCWTSPLGSHIYIYIYIYMVTSCFTYIPAMYSQRLCFYSGFTMRPKHGGPMPARFLVSHAGETTISHYLKNSQMMGFQELFIWLAQEHYFWRLTCVLASLGSSLGAHGSSWRLLGDLSLPFQLFWCHITCSLCISSFFAMCNLMQNL